MASLPSAVGVTAALVVGRVIEGAAMVAVWVGYEAALFSRATAANRATVSTLYAMVLAFGYVVGPLLARGLMPFGVASLPFWVAAALTIANALGVRAFVRAEAPSSVEHFSHASSGAERASHARDALDANNDVSGPENSDAVHHPPLSVRPAASFGALAWRVKTTGFGMFAAGYLKASLILFLPLFLVDHRGQAEGEPPLVLSAYAAGSLAFTHLAGRLGDRRGHLVTMAGLAAIGGTSMLGFLFVRGLVPTCALAFLGGATLGAISPLGMALQASIAARADYTRAMSLSNGLYAAGTLAGPFVTGLVYARAPSGAMIQVAAMWLAFTAFCIAFAGDDPAGMRRA